MPNKTGRKAICGTDGQPENRERRAETINSENKINKEANAEQDKKPMRLTKRIGSTTYKVSVHFSRTSKETMGDKIIRIIENEAANQ